MTANTLAFLRGNFRWLLPGTLLTFLSSFGQTFYIALFAGEIRTTFELTHGAWGGIYALGTMASAVVMIWAGVLTDHFRVRALGAVMLVVLAGACLAMAQTSAVWMLPIVIFVLRFAGQGMLTHISAVAMARWFVATRGRALSIAALGFSIGQACLPLAVVALMVSYDWQTLWYLAALVALIGIPILWQLLAQERTPQNTAQSSNSFGMCGRHWSRKQAIHHGLFWSMLPTLMGPPAFITAFFFQQVHLADIKDWSHLDFVALFPLFTVTSIAAMLVSGWALDRWGTARLLPWYQVPVVIGFLIIALVDTVWGAVFGMVFIGLTSGCNATLITAFWAEFYGTRHMGAIKSVAAAIMVFASAVGPAITGVLIDWNIGLEEQFLAIALYFVLASLVMTYGLRRYSVLLTKPT